MVGARRLAIVAATLVSALVLAAAAPAAVRYAEPSGNGPEATCPKANPCSLLDAIESPSLEDGDRVVLTPGTYPVGETISVSNRVTIQGTRGRPRAARVVASSAIINFFQISFRATLRDFAIEDGDNVSANALFAPAGAVAHRMFVRADSAQRACNLGGTEGEPPALVTNTVCWNTSPNFTALNFGADSAESFAPIARHVTAIATGGGTSTGLRASAIGAGTSLVVDARNVIASGTTDVEAEKQATSVASSVILYNSSFFETQNDPGASVSSPASNDNVALDPILVDPAGGDFHPRRSSPTVDTGRAFADIGPFDLDGHARNQGRAPDIGAFEFTSKPCFGRAPTVAGRGKLRGTPGPDVLLGFRGRNRLVGKGGKDRLCGGGGKDKLAGGGGRDRLNGGAGKEDKCNGGGGRDARAKGCEEISRIP